MEACPVGAAPQDCRSRSLEGAGGGPLTLEGLQRDRIYEVRVVATNGQGDGPSSRPVSVYVGEAGQYVFTDLFVDCSHHVSSSKLNV